MRRIGIACMISLSMLFILQCSDDKPLKSKDTVEFIVTARDYVPQLDSPLGDWLTPTDYLNLYLAVDNPSPGPNPGPYPPPIGQAVCFEIDPRSSPSNPYLYDTRPVSLEFKPEIRIYPPDSESYRLAEIDTGSPNDPEYFARTPYDTVCFDATSKAGDADPNYQFSVTANDGKVVGFFKKKMYSNQYDWKNNAIMHVDVYINGVYYDAFETDGYGLTIVVPVQ